MTDILRIENLKKYYYEDGKRRVIKALDGINLSLGDSEVLGIIGESGCGKSTLGKLIVGLEEPSHGEIFFQSRSTEDYLKKDRLAFRKNLQMVFQNPFDVFDPRIKIGRSLTSALKIHGIGASKDERLDIVRDYMERSGISPWQDFADRYPHELSGGQLQRISIIRSMILNPKLIVADEPVSMLDVSIRAEIINTLMKITSKEGTGMVFISHDIATTRYVSDRIAVMYLGRIVELGSRDEIIDSPLHPYTKALISNCGSIDPRDKLRPIRIDGEPPTPVNTGPGCYFYKRCYKACDRCSQEYPDFIEWSKGHYVSCFNID